MTDDELEAAVSASLPGSWSTEVTRRNGLRRVKSTRDVHGETACALTAVPDDAEHPRIEDLISEHVHCALDDVAALIVYTAAQRGILPRAADPT